MAKAPKWAVVATWQRYSLHVLKDEAEAALKAWKAAREAEGLDVGGSIGAGYVTKSAPEGAARQSARVIKLADHPVCYIGVVESDVQRLRAMEEAGNPAFDEYSARAKAISEGWERVEAL